MGILSLGTHQSTNLQFNINIINTTDRTNIMILMYINI